MKTFINATILTVMLLITVACGQEQPSDFYVVTRCNTTHANGYEITTCTQGQTLISQTIVPE